MKNTRSLLAVILACMMVMSCIVVVPVMAVADVWDGTSSQEWYTSGMHEGTVGDPYEISSAADLAGLAEIVNAGNRLSGKYIVLTTDIDLDNISWTPIGGYIESQTRSFNANFNGQGHTISNLTIDGSFYWTGFFGAIGSNAMTISNLTIDGADVTSGSNGAGVLVGAATGSTSQTITFDGVTIENAALTSTQNNGTALLFGRAAGFKSIVFNDCSVSGSISASGRNGVGGILGMVPSALTTGVSFTNCSVNATGDGFVAAGNIGGIFGYTNSAAPSIDFTGCSVNGTISSTGESAGGLYGTTTLTAFNMTMTGCYVGATITNTSSRAGGFIGSLRGGASSVGAYITINGCVFDGTVSGSGQVGGIMGASVHNSNSITISNTVILGTITSSGNKGVLIGQVGLTKNLSDVITVSSFYNKSNLTNLFTFVPNGGSTEAETVNSVTYITPGAADATYPKADDYTIETFLTAFKMIVSAYDWYAGTTCVSCNTWDYEASDSSIHTLKCDKLCPNSSIITGDMVWDGSYDVAWYVGHESDSSYDITTAEQLAGLAMIVAGLAEDGGTPIAADNFNGKTIYLKNDLKLNSDEDLANLGTWGTSAPANNWFPIGNYASVDFGAGTGWKNFRGTFDGEDHTITGMYCNGQDTYFGVGSLYYAGLFGTANAVSNLTLNNSYVHSGGNATGAIAATHRDASPVFTSVNVENVTVVSNNNNGTALLIARTGTVTDPSFTDCSVSGTIGSDSNRVNYVGGLIGNSSANMTRGVVSGCTVNGTIYGAQCVGGVVGGNEGGAVDLTVSGTTVSGTFDASGAGVGGMFGLIKNASNITVGSGSVSAATVNAPGQRGGGIFGQTANATAVTISDTTFSGAVSGLGNIGGMIGEVNSTGNVVIEGSTLSGSVTKTSDSNFYGGLIGCIGTSATDVNISITNVKSTSAASVTGYDYSGIFVGASRIASTITVTNCEIAGSINARNVVGGVLGGRHSGDAPAVTCTGVYVKANITGSSLVGALVGRDASGTMVMTATNCRIEPSAANVYAFVGATAAGTSVTLGNNVVVGDAAGYVQGSATVTQSSGTKVYTYGTVSATAGVDAITASDDAVVAFVPAWNTATSGYTSWTEAAGGTKSDWYETTGGFYRLSALELYRGTTVDTNKFLFETVGGSIRYTEPYGFRFGARIKGTDLEAGTFGMLIIPTDMLAGDLTITTPQVLNIVAAKTFGAGDTSGMYKDGYTAFTGVVTNIPESGYNRALTAVAYCTYDDVTYYSDAMTGSYYQVAKILLQNDGWVAENPDAATVLEGIVATVEG